jgi:hypothetical protein
MSWRRDHPRQPLIALIWVVDGVGIDVRWLFVEVYFVDTLASYASELFGIRGMLFGEAAPTIGVNIQISLHAWKTGIGGGVGNWGAKLDFGRVDDDVCAKTGDGIV